ncbi:uncharacterized protein IL334_002195 [Kwoniella shivajii]|uniref:ATP-grasp domain-containing protein n=1 Tax=Kwoniella shivajii TaxID=564305 RepID=A0ABZ1CV69_9TREE|nr:hypothetical protein IL334_002195 [Kwoniella shivajii]
MKIKLPSTGFKTALLHQRAPLPVINGVKKSLKPGGYADGAADIAYALRSAGETVITPVGEPNPTTDLDWSFPDTVTGIRDAVEKGADVIWANGHTHSQHALVELRKELAVKGVRMVGQNPISAEKFDDKEWANRWLASHESLRGSFPRSLLYRKGDEKEVSEFPLPAMAKPVRGRGSHGVVKVSTPEEIDTALQTLLKESDAVLIEEYLAGEEITVTVMPPAEYSTEHWAFPVVHRFDQINGVLPWNGTVPVTENSRVLSVDQHDADPAYSTVQSQCVLVAQLYQAVAPMRIDCRRKESGGPFIIFDVNVKPNAGGPGRPGRDGQAALTTMAAETMGWDWPEFAVNLLRTGTPIDELLAQKFKW